MQKQIRFKSELSVLRQLERCFRPTNIDIKCEEVLAIELQEVREQMSKTQNEKYFYQLAGYESILVRAIENRKSGQVIN